MGQRIVIWAVILCGVGGGLPVAGCGGGSSSTPSGSSGSSGSSRAAPGAPEPVPVSGPPPVTHARIGLSDQDPAAFASPYVGELRRRLRMSLARLIVPFDNPGSAAPWLAAVHAAGLAPFVSLSGDDSCRNPAGTRPATGNCPPPSDATFRADFAATVRALPGVHEWGAWSEPSNYRYWPCATPNAAPAPPAGACGQRILDPGQAARYWRDAAAVLRSLRRSDTVVALETGIDCNARDQNLCGGDGGAPFTGYIPRYLAALGSDRPAVWGTHSYHDLQLQTAPPATETDRFVRFLGSQGTTPEIWLTEEGVWLGGLDGAAVAGNATAQAGAARAFLALPTVPSARPGQIAREYYYLLRGKPGATFDSALLDLSGRPRAAYCVLVGADPSRCAGNPANMG